MKSHGRLVRPGLVGVDHDSPRKTRASGSAASRRSTPVRVRTASAARGSAVAAVTRRCGPRTAPGSRSISRRTNRQSMPARAQAATIAVEPVARRVRDRHEHGVGMRLREHPVDLVEPAEDGHALDPPAPQPRVVVDEADDLLARGLAQLAQQAAARAPGADDRARGGARCGRAGRAARGRAPRSPNREAPTARCRRARRSRRPRAGTRCQSCVAARKPNATASEITTAATIASASRAPAYRHTPR